MAILVANIRQQRYPFLILFFSLIANFAAAGENFPFLGQVTAEGVNIRAGQSANFEKVGQLKSGDQVVVTEKSFSWYKIKLPVNAKSYISAKYIKELDEKTGEVTTDRVNIRAGNGEQFSILGQAAKGQYVRVLEKLDGWYKIEPIEESFGWLSEGYIKYFSNELPLKRIVQAPIRNIYERKRLASVQAAENLAPAGAASPDETEIQKSAFATGVVEALGERSLAKDIRHVVTGEDNAAYYLKAPPEIADVFLHRKVAIEGTVQSDIIAPHPVVLIKKINLIL